MRVERDTVDVPPPPPHVEMSNVAWWKEQCGGQDREVVSQTGFSAETCEQLWLKYGDRGPLKERQNLLAGLVSLKTSPTEGQLPRVLPGASRFVRINEIKDAFAYLADVVDDIQWDSRLSHLNHVTHFPYYLTFFVDTVPFACFAGISENIQPKYAGPVMKMQVCCDALGRIVFISGPHPGSRSDSMLSKRWRPKTFCGQELGGADGAYSGNFRLAAPYRKPKRRPLPACKDRYNQIHAFFTARVEHIFTRIWPFAIVHQVWRGKGLEGACELQRRIHVHFINFELSRKIMYEPAGVWSHTPEGAPAAEEVEYETPEGVIGDDSPDEGDEEESEDDVGPARCQDSASHEGGGVLSTGLQEWLRQGKDRFSSSNHLNVWQPRLTRSEAARVCTEMALSAAELDRYLHRDD